jgi:hypothetical protein
MDMVRLTYTKTGIQGNKNIQENGGAISGDASIGDIDLNTLSVSQ